MCFHGVTGMSMGTVMISSGYLWGGVVTIIDTGGGVGFSWGYLVVGILL